MLFKSKKDKDHVIFMYCDCLTHFVSPPLIDDHGFNFQDDFEESGKQGSPKIQIIWDIKNEFDFYNQDGNLYTFWQARILTRDWKLKGNVVKNIFGPHSAFYHSDIWLFEVGIHDGEIDFMTLDYPVKKNERHSFESEKRRKIVYKFPLFWFMRQVVDLEEKKIRESLILDKREILLENENKMLSHEKLKGWQVGERIDNISPWDPYGECLESPLEDYNFRREEEDQVSIRLHYEFFLAFE